MTLDIGYGYWYLMNLYSSHYNHCTKENTALRLFFKLVINEFNLESGQCAIFFKLIYDVCEFCLLTDHYGLLFVYFLFTPDFFCCMFS